MSFKQVVRKQIHTILENVPVKLWRILNGIFRFYFKPFNIDRYEVCKNCQECIMIKRTKFCNVCGCVIKYKVQAKDEHCPLNKW